MIGIAVMLLLAIGIVFFVILYQRRVISHQQEIEKINKQKQQELLQASIQGEEVERQRIASELHDDVGATLSSIRLFLHAAGKQKEDPELIDQSNLLLDESIQKIRDISHKLQPATLQHLGLQASLQALTELISRSGNVQMKYLSPGKLPRLDDQVGLSVYRVVQELTNNILKHAGASAIFLEATLSGDDLRLVLSHNGAGLTEEDYQQLIYKKGAIGLKNIVNRIKSINASIQFSKAEKDLYQIVISTPVQS